MASGLLCSWCRRSRFISRFRLFGSVDRFRREIEYYNDTMNKLTKSAVALALLASAPAFATAITGGITFTAEVAQTWAQVTGGTTFTPINGKVANIPAAYGSFTGLTSLDAVTFGALTVTTPTAAITAPAYLVGGFSFSPSNPGSAASFSLGPNSFLNVSFTGIISGNGYEATPGALSFTFSNSSPSTQVSFGATSVATPDAGSTMVLLGLGALALGVRRSLKA